MFINKHTKDSSEDNPSIANQTRCIGKVDPCKSSEQISQDKMIELFTEMIKMLQALTEYLKTFRKKQSKVLSTIQSYTNNVPSISNSNISIKLNKNKSEFSKLPASKDKATLFQNNSGNHNDINHKRKSKEETLSISPNLDMTKYCVVMKDDAKGEKKNDVTISEIVFNSENEFSLIEKYTETKIIHLNNTNIITIILIDHFNLDITSGKWIENFIHDPGITKFSKYSMHYYWNGIYLFKQTKLEITSFYQLNSYFMNDLGEYIFNKRKYHRNTNFVDFLLFPDYFDKIFKFLMRLRHGNVSVELRKILGNYVSLHWILKIMLFIIIMWYVKIVYMNFLCIIDLKLIIIVENYTLKQYVSREENVIEYEIKERNSIRVIYTLLMLFLANLIHYYHRSISLIIIFRMKYFGCITNWLLY